MSMIEIEEIVNEWESTLCNKVDIGGLYTRDPTAHKWKITYRCFLLRELVSWRLVDITKTSDFLGERESHPWI